MNEFERKLFSLLDIGSSIHHFNKESERRLGLSLVQWCLLKRLIDMPSASAQSLASEVGVHPSTLTQTIKRLERKSFVFVTEDPRDSRKKLISITRLGKEHLDSATLQMKTWLQELTPLGDDLHRVSSALHLPVFFSSAATASPTPDADAGF